MRTMKKQNLQQKAQKQALKDEKIHNMEVTAAEAVVQSLTDAGLQMKAEYLEEKVRLEVTIAQGRHIAVQTDYKNFNEGYENILNFLKKLL